ncbi:2-dehydropantoate 2-reductase [Clostridium acetobutylicum]|uniref:Ketopantoate reductase n=1 Tax=Clostridium acetobutylicum (strain ATCC 824 / DSM 792 / JCM 1419 / IAM 19013 / LMG 5710 / NBRC 13948 / NRRL B-527 / VKM B-1787 / 2291 / W) TaxID=272562 RepID=Q97J15_CLOAB|nr:MULTISPECIES: ketopantoate reductase family protein [Clostridium]AAK79439.1 Ketopantoate reductase [Clostridium acetobutylicum ATCC 824]ADZ20524.1 Ketopantoate reductase [Clostridium acetobutylicum EA 2018]AEI31826.1 ketopantoate reductase [Clostridium acetobutylicum DSM 1731]AWV81315.1 ketopantoate reductase family protein [Clostridium acetobutylicum]MBC2392948.1 ketopantoate reductase family protein [Clostridium acetobutylicum]
MKILIYGAGVLGSYAAYELKRVGHEVTILARSSRYEELKEKGLVIRHWFQRKTTKNKINVVKELLPEEYYDAVFIVMQSSQTNAILPVITANVKCPLFVFVGNQDKAKDISEKIKSTSKSNPRVLFGFFSIGGRREGGKVISVHTKHPDFDIGDLEGRDDYKIIIEKIFKETSFKLHYHVNMDDFFKTHIVVIMPLAYLAYMSNCDLRKIAWNRKALNAVIDAMIEGHEVLIKLGHKVDPESSERLLRNHRKVAYLGLKVCAMTPLGKLGISDHCKSGWREMEYLDKRLLEWAKKSNLETPNINKLREHLIKYVHKKVI